jgi:hypothetical protein
MGGLLESLLDYLQIQTGIDFEEYMKEWHRRRRLVGRFHRFGESPCANPKCNCKSTSWEMSYSLTASCTSIRAEHQYIYRNVVRDNTSDSDLSMAPIEEVVTNVTADENDGPRKFGYVSHDGELSSRYASDDQFGYVSHNPTDERSRENETDGRKPIV